MALASPVTARLPAMVLAPNPAKKTLVIERFIALHMISVRMTPLAPTRQPATISTVFRITKPAAAAGQARVTIEQGNDDRHIRAANRHHRQNAEHEGENDDKNENRDNCVAG